ncbi:MAG TPA: hypothetical protein VN805_11055 [Caulobacteraceae bacterium]|nr:hypothetical protein [Caulobacteraceae bacterium]
MIATDDKLADVGPAIPQKPAQTDSLAVLTAHMEYARRDLAKVIDRVDEISHPETGLFARLIKLESEVSQLPKKGYIISVVVIALTVVGLLLSLQTGVQHFWPPGNH